MALGPGKYDDLATVVLERSAAAGVIVIVVGGTLGSGFSVQATAEVTAKLPRLLRILADGIEGDVSAPEPTHAR
jgi:hypothetical protein